MATVIASPDQNNNQVPVHPGPGDQFLQNQIESARKGLWRDELTKRVLRLLLFWLAIGLLWTMIDHWIWSPGFTVRCLTAVSIAATSLFWIVRGIIPVFRCRINHAYAAHAIERDLPELRHALTSYVTLQDQMQASGLRGVVLRSIGARAAAGLHRNDYSIPSEATGSFRLWIGLAAMLAVTLVYSVVAPKSIVPSLQRLLMPLTPTTAPTRVQISEINPGDVEIMAGQSVVIDAKISNLRQADTPYLELRSTGKSSWRLELLPDPVVPKVFQVVVGDAEAIQVDSQYRIVAGDAISQTHRIAVQSVPVANIQSVTYLPPAYTGLPQRTRRTAAVEGLEGTRIRIEASTNLPVAAARVELNPRELRNDFAATGGEINATISPDGQSITAEFMLRAGDSSRSLQELDSYRLLVFDDAGRQNPAPVIYPIRVLTDLAPEVSIVVPVESPKDIPVDAQQLIEVHALDPDYGLTEVALLMERGTQKWPEVVLWQDLQGDRQNRVAVFRFRPESWKLRPGQQVTLTAIARDNRHDPSGESAPNVTRSEPIVLRIADPASALSDQPMDDGLSAPDDKPAVDPTTTPDQQRQDQPGQDADADQQPSAAEDGSKTEPGQNGEGDGSEQQNGQSAGQQQNDTPDSGDNGNGSGAGGDDSQMPADATDQDQRGSSPSGTAGDEATSVGRDEPGATESGAEPSSADPSSTDPSGAASESNESAGDPVGQQADGTEGTMPEEGVGESTDGNDVDQSGADTDRTAPPQDDGEAFERIRDFIQRQQQAGEGDQQSPGDAPEARPEGQAGEQPIGEQADAPESTRQPDREAMQQEDGQVPDRARPSPTEEEPSDSPRPSQADAEATDPSSGDPQPEAEAGTTDEADPTSPPAATDDTAAGDSDADPERNTQPDQLPDTDDFAAEPGIDQHQDTASPMADEQTSGESQQDSSPAESAGAPSSDHPDAADSPESAAEAPQSSDDAPGSQPSTMERPGEGDAGEGLDDAETSTAEAPTPSSTGEPTGGGPSSQMGEQADRGQDTSLDPPAPQADPADMEYAQKATDLVLDYLEQNRDRPAEDLLRDLNWTEADLRAFEERWQQTRRLADQPASGAQDEFAEALKSLGLRPEKPTRQQQRRTDDRLRGLEDSGQRLTPPPLYRDLFDAFRRGDAR